MLDDGMFSRHHAICDVTLRPGHNFRFFFVFVLFELFVFVFVFVDKGFAFSWRFGWHCAGTVTRGCR